MDKSLQNTTCVGFWSKIFNYSGFPCDLKQGNVDICTVSTPGAPSWKQYKKQDNLNLNNL